LVTELEILFLHSKLEFFTAALERCVNMDSNSKRQKKKSPPMEKWYQGRGDSSMLANYGDINAN
jgi:hypothetical protein